MVSHRFFARPQANRSAMLQKDSGSRLASMSVEIVVAPCCPTHETWEPSASITDGEHVVILIHAGPVRSLLWCIGSYKVVNSLRPVENKNGIWHRLRSLRGCLIQRVVLSGQSA